jgi:uncharacterized protein (DUF427 family)
MVGMSQALEDRHIPDVARPAQGGPTVRVEPYRRRIRGRIGAETIVDTRTPLLLLEDGHLPVYYLPVEDVRADLLEPSDRRTTCPRKGEATYQTIHVGDRVVPNAVWRYEHPIEGCPDISGHVAFYWNALDSWWEEDDQVFVHARDPYKRVDVLRSSRHVRVELDGELLAESHRPLLLFETGLPTRYYLPPSDVRLELMEASRTRTSCPYKGTASYLSPRVGGELRADLAWTYDRPIPECSKIEQAVCFFNERVDLTVDGELQERPVTAWS